MRGVIPFHSALTVIRFLSFVPLGFYCFSALSDSILISSHAGMLLAPPLSHKIQIGEQIAGVAGVLAYTWNLITFVPALKDPVQLLLYLGIADALLVIVLIVVTSIETGYVGRTLHQCGQVPPDGMADQRLIFFERARPINSPDPDYGKELCQDFLSKFYTGVALMVVYGIFAWHNLYVGASIWPSKVAGYNDRVPMWGNEWRWTFPFALLWSALVQAFTYLFFVLPKSIRTPIRFSGRYAGKWGYHHQSSAKTQIGQIVGRQSGGSCENKEPSSTVVDTLLYDIIVLVAPELHYVDLVNFSLISKRVRASMFTTTAEKGRNQQLRRYSCLGSGKSDCWYCSCNMLYPNEHVSFHLQYCRAWCSRCFCSAAKSPHPRIRCRHGQKQDHESYKASPVQSSAHAGLDRKLCRDCHKMDRPYLLAQREKRDLEILTDQDRLPSACGKCARPLPRTGPMWWVCSNCLVECRSRNHPGWWPRPKLLEV